MIKITRPTTTVKLATDLSARQEWEQAVQDEAAATLDSARRRMSDTKLAEAHKRIDDAREAMAASELTFTLVALPRSEYTKLVAAHPAQPGIEQDEQQGVHVETFGDALLEASILRVNDADGTPLDFNPAKEWKQLADDMTDGQWSEFYRAAISLNKGTTAVPRKRAS